MQALSHLPIDEDHRLAFPDITERLSGYEIIWIRKGQLHLELNLKTCRITEGNICALAPGQIRRIKFDQEVQGDYMRLNADYFYRICAEARFPLIPLDAHHLGKAMIIQITEESQHELNDIFKKISELSLLSTAGSELMSIWLRLFMLYLKKHVDPQQRENLLSRDMELANEFLNLLSRNYATKKMVADYANDLHVTPNYLNQIVKRVSGFSVSHHIQQFLILEAKRQALGSTRSMKQIAYDLGFDDIAHFSKFFKNKSGTNFTEFKRSGLSIQL